MLYLGFLTFTLYHSVFFPSLGYTLAIPLVQDYISIVYYKILLHTVHLCTLNYFKLTCSFHSYLELERPLMPVNILPVFSSGLNCAEDEWKIFLCKVFCGLNSLKRLVGDCLATIAREKYIPWQVMIGSCQSVWNWLLKPQSCASIDQLWTSW